MSERLRRFRRRVVAVSCLVTAVCAALCLGLLCFALVRADLAEQRQTLEMLSNMPFTSDGSGARETGAGDAEPITVAGVPAFYRTLVSAEGEVTETQRGGAPAVSLEESDLATLVSLRDERGSDVFWHEGRVWIGLWLPGEAEDSGAPEATLQDAGAGAGEGVYVQSASPEQSRRVYTFLDVTESIEQAGWTAMACAFAVVALACAAGCISWFTTTRALRPVVDAEARERAFVTDASHGLKTPLMAIIANCDVLETEASDRHDLAPWIASIREAADDMAARIAEMLANITRDDG